MAKTEKKVKKVISKKADPTKKKSAILTSKVILAKAAALAESSNAESGEASPPSKPSPASVKKTLDSDDSSDSSSSEESSSEESDTSKKGKVSTPVKATPAAVPEAESSSDSSSAASSSEKSSDEDSDDEEMASIPAKASPDKGKKASDSKDDSSDESSSDESSSGSDSDEDEDTQTSAPDRTVPVKATKKRQVESEADAVSKKVKLANGTAAPSEETKGIFVGKLSWNVDNDWLAQEFAECGEVESAHVAMDRNTGRSRGFGYVHFKTADAVEKALALDGKEIDGRAVNVDKSNPRDKKASMEKRAQVFGDASSPPSAVLFVGNLSFGVDEDTLWETFGEHGDIKSVRVPTDRDTGKPKGFAYVEFSDVGSAKKAHGALHGIELDGRSIRLDFSQPRDSAGGRGGGYGGRGRGGFGERGGFGGRGGFGERGGFGGRGGFGNDRGRGASRGGRGGDRGGRGRGRGRGGRTGGFAQFEGQKITFD